jgi:hypothetical protein
MLQRCSSEIMQQESMCCIAVQQHRISGCCLHTHTWYAGTLAYDEAVVQYMQKLEDHRRKCEVEGRYAEAKAAARRLAELRTAQVARLRQELVDNQAKELGWVGNPGGGGCST